MSLAVAEDRGRDRSRSRDRRSKDEAGRSSVAKSANAREPTLVYLEDNVDDRHRSRNTLEESSYGRHGLPYAPDDGRRYPTAHGSQALHNHDDSRPFYPTTSPAIDTSFGGCSEPSHSGQRPRDTYDGMKGNPEISHAFPPQDEHPFVPQKYMTPYVNHDVQGARDGDYSRHDRGGRRHRGRDTRSRRERDEDDLAYGKLPGPPRSRPTESPPTYGTYISGARITEKHPVQHREPSYRGEPRAPAANGLAAVAGTRDRARSRHRRRDKSPGPSMLAPVSDGKGRDGSRDRRGASRERSPQPPTARMSGLTLGAGLAAPSTSPPAASPSPLLEPYRGTYQDCSPMPSPLLIPSKTSGSDVRIAEAPSPIASDMEGDGRRRSRRARFHDPEAIASQLARALRGDGAPDTQPLIEILPSLTHEQVMELRARYKRIVKTGSDRKGVNVAKHIRARLKDEDPNLMKACYAVALGRWESEAYWANFWYQGNKTRRELLIESLMGRTDEEIRQIKKAFADKKYDKSLTKCMKTELKEDKFKKAVLMVLEGHRMDEHDSSGRRVPLDYHMVDEDVGNLRKAIKAEKGGESAMIGIVVKRGDGHLRAVLQEYEHHYRANFAREALKKSDNLVGELLAHILNGVINKPVRDALLLHHALTASRKDTLRRELLTSRLVRLHWDALHMQAVKNAYRERYGADLSDAVREATCGVWGEFCRELCIGRMPERVQIIR